MQLNLTPKQYAILIKLVYLGNLVVNSRLSPDERLPEFGEVEKLVYTQAGGLAEEMGLRRDETGRLLLSASLEEELTQIIDDYEEECFWDQLSQRLAYRDLLEELGEEALEKMPPRERAEALYRREERYDREFEESGLEDLRLIKIKI